jgi:hypothetical protein
VCDDRYSDSSSTFEINFAEYLRSRWVRVVGSEVVWEPNDDLLRDRSFNVVNLRGTTLLVVERSGLSGSLKRREQLSLLLRAGNFPEAIAVWKAAASEGANLPIRRMLLVEACTPDRIPLLQKTHCHKSSRCVGVPCSWT